MTKKSKTILIASVCCMAAGALLAGAGILSGGTPGFLISKKGISSGSSSDSGQYTLRKTMIDDKMEMASSLNIELDGSAADVELLPSGDGHFYLEYALDGTGTEPDWGVENKTLNFTQKEEHSIMYFSGIFGISSFGMSFSSDDAAPCYVRIYIPPETHLDELTVSNDHGNLDLRSVYADSSEITADYGDITIKDSTFSSLSLAADSGEVNLSSSTVGTLEHTNEYGSSSFRDSTIKEAYVEMSSGELYFDAKGLETLSGTNEYGDCRIVLYEPLESYSFDLYTDFGEISLPSGASGQMGGDEFGIEMSYRSDGGSGNKIEFTADSGNIEIEQK